MHRNMSYRKPAPVYAPSPPTSPAPNPRCPSFLTSNGVDQLNLPESSKEKPLPAVPASKQAPARPLTCSRSANVESLPLARQASKARTTSSGALSSLNYYSDSENTNFSCISNTRSKRWSSSQQSRQAYAGSQPYRPPTPPRQTENRRYSKGYTTTILHRDDRGRKRVSTSIHSQYDRTHSSDTYYERQQLHGPRASRALRAESMRSCMTERTQFSLGASEAWSGGTTLVTTTEGYQSFPVLPTVSKKEVRDGQVEEPEPEEFEFVHSSFWGRMGMWVWSLKMHSKHALRGCCL